MTPTSLFIGTRLEAWQALSMYTKVIMIMTPENSVLSDHCRKNGIEFEVVSKSLRESNLKQIATLDVDVVFSAGFPFIIPHWVFISSRAKFYNSHPALLPAYRGANAIKDALKKGEIELGVTVHEMAEIVDNGRIIHQERIDVASMEVKSVYLSIFGFLEPMTILRAFEKLSKSNEIKLGKE